MVVVAGVQHGRGQHGQVAILGHAREEGPALLSGQAHDLDDLLHLVALEGHRLLVHLGLLPLKDGPQR